MDGDVGVCSHDLLFWGQFGTPLEFKVTKGPRQGQVAVDTAKVDKTACGANTGFLAYISNNTNQNKKLSRDNGPQTFVLRLVVKRKGFCAALDTQHRARVTCIGLIWSLNVSK